MRSPNRLKLLAKETFKLQALEKLVPIPKTFKKGLAFPKDFRAAVIMDSKKELRYFVFDVKSFWDMLCVFDEAFEKTASTEEYFDQNPMGWLIDAIEKHLPLNPKFIHDLKRSIKEAEKLGTVPFEKIKEKLGIAA